MKKWIIIPIILFLLLYNFILVPTSISLIIEPGTYFEVTEGENIFTNYSYSFESGLQGWEVETGATRTTDESYSGSWSLKMVSSLGVFTEAIPPDLLLYNKDAVNVTFWVFAEENIQLFTHTLKVYYNKGIGASQLLDTIDMTGIITDFEKQYINISAESYTFTEDSYIWFEAYATSDDPEEEGTLYLDYVKISIYDSVLLENYTVAYPMNFSQVKINESWITFNNTGFNITAPNDIWVVLYYIHSDLLTASAGDYILNFSATTTSGNVWFNLSGFATDNNYSIYRNDTLLTTNISNATGVIHFNNSEWSERNFSIRSLEASVSPTVTTNESTGVEETNATLHGYLDDDGGETCTVRFEYGTTSSYGTNTTNQTKSEGNEFFENTHILYTRNPGVEDNGTYTQIAHQHPDSTYHWDKVDDFLADDDSTYVYQTGSITRRDTYNMVNYTLVGYDPILNFTVMYRVKNDYQPWSTMKAIIRTHGNNYYGTSHSIAETWTTYSATWDVNPYTSNAWTWDEINSTEIGISITCSFTYVKCTQVYGKVISVNTSSLLLPGQLYHYRAAANNSNGTGYGSDMMFLTKPNVTTTGYANTTNIIDINISWTKADGANNTYVERNTVSSWSRGAGTLIYNDTGTYYYDNSTAENPLEIDTTYYYRLWSWANWSWNATTNFSQWSGSSLLLSNTTDEVDPPYNGNRDYDGGTSTVNLTWTRGNYSDQELVIRRNDTYATSATQSGNWVRQNNTNTYYNDSYVEGGYYTVWSWNETDRIYSLTGLNIPWGALYIGCYNESNMSQFITFNIEISNEGGTEVYIQEGISSWLYISYDDIPTGDHTIFIFSATGYRQRTYYYDIDENNLYNISAYLPPIEGEGGGGGEDCQSLLYRDSVAVTNPNADATIALTKELEEIVNVDIYNESLYGTYGGWIDIPGSNYTYSSTQVIVNQSVLDANTTMARATYYYEHCGDVSSILCQITVISEDDQRIPDVKCTVQRLNSDTEEYVNVSVEYTDGNGQFTVWLIPNVNYRFVLYKENYIQQGSKFWIPSAQEYTKVFMLEYVSTEPDLFTFSDIIHFNATINSTGYITIWYNDINSNTIDTSIRIYEYYNYTMILNHTDNRTGENTFTFSVSGFNTSREHAIKLTLNHSDLGYEIAWIYVHAITDKSSESDLESKFVAVFGIFDLGWVKFLIIFTPCIFILVVFGKRHTGMSIMGAGMYLGFAALFIDLSHIVEYGSIASLLVVVGIATIYAKEGRDSV